MKKDAKIYVAGHRGMVGSALMRRRRRNGYINLLTRTSAELDLRDQGAVASFFAEEVPEYMLLDAAKVGGIHANNTCRGDFIYDNPMIQSNVLHQSYRHGVRKLLNVSKLADLGWHYRIPLQTGLRAVLASAEWQQKLQRALVG